MHGILVAELNPNDLFRIGALWYRLLHHEDNGTSKVRTADADKKTVFLDSVSEITELSVLSKA